MSTQTADLTLRELALDIKESLVEGKNLEVESYVESLSERSGINLYDIKDIYNCLYLIHSGDIDIAPKRRWQDYEDNLITRYIDVSKKFDIPVRDSLRDLEELLIDRTYASLTFRYYKVLYPNPNLKSNKKKAKIKSRKVGRPASNTKKDAEPEMEQKQETKPELKAEQEPVINEQTSFYNEPIIEDEPVISNIAQPIEEPKKDEDDLIDVVAEIVENVDTANVDVSSLFKGILKLSQKAVDNTQDERKIKELENELKTEKEYNKMLEDEYSLLLKDLEVLKQEVEKYNEMTSKDKLRNFREYNDNVRYIVDKFGTVNKVQEKQSV